MISILMATYNSEKFIREQIESILNQTYKDFELIVADDLSSDLTVEIVEHYIKQDSRIKLYVNKINLGFKKNFEENLKYCSGDYIAFSDHDDIWASDKLEKSINQIGDKDIFCSNALCIDSFGNSLGYTMKDVLMLKELPDDQDYFFKFFFHSNFVQGSTILAKRDFILKNLPIPAVFKFHDGYFAIKASVQNGIVYSDECLLNYRQHQSQVTENIKKSFFKKFISTDLSDFVVFCKNKFDECVYVLNNFSLSTEKRAYVEETKKYYESLMKGKMFSVAYFRKYFYQITGDCNKKHKMMKTLKRFLSLPMMKKAVKQYDNRNSDK